MGGIFGFKWSFLKWFASQDESPLELKEACDSNRIYDNGFTQRVVIMPAFVFISFVDSPPDIEKVERAMKHDFYTDSH